MSRIVRTYNLKEFQDKLESLSTDCKLFFSTEKSTKQSLLLTASC